MAGGFSRKFVESETDHPILLNGIDDSTRVALNNLTYKLAFDWHNVLGQERMRMIVERVWEFLDMDLSNLYFTDGRLQWGKVKKSIDELPWNGVYDMVHELAQVYSEQTGIWIDEQVNKILERGRSGYRMVNGEYQAITDELELFEHAEAVHRLERVGLHAARQHLNDAMRAMSDYGDPDYRGAIRESIHAIESVVRLLTGKPNAKQNTQLDKALKKISSKVPIHPNLVNAFSQLYRYSSDEEGIRHAMIEADKADYATAKFMVVSCSAFINYMTLKAEEEGVEFKTKDDI